MVNLTTCSKCHRDLDYCDCVKCCANYYSSRPEDHRAVGRESLGSRNSDRGMRIKTPDGMEVDTRPICKPRDCRQEFIDRFISQFLASWCAVNFVDMQNTGIYNMPVRSAKELAKKAWGQLNDHGGDH